MYSQSEILEKTKDAAFTTEDGKITFRKKHSDGSYKDIEAKVKLDSGEVMLRWDDLNVWGIWTIEVAKSNRLAETIAALKTLSQYVDVDLPDLSEIVVEKNVEVAKEVPTDNPVHVEALKVAGMEMERLKGKLEVYENLTNGRTVTFDNRLRVAP